MAKAPAPPRPNPPPQPGEVIISAVIVRAVMPVNMAGSKTGGPYGAATTSDIPRSRRAGLSSLEGQRSPCTGGKKNSFPIIPTQSHSGPRHKHTGLDKCRGSGNTSFNRGQCIQGTNLFGGSLLDTICAQYYRSIWDSHLLPLLCSAKDEMGVRRNGPILASGNSGEQPERVFNNAGHGRSQGAIGQDKRCNSGGSGRKPAFRVGVVFTHPRNRYRINTDDRGTISHQVNGGYNLGFGGGGGVGTALITCPNTPLVGGGGGGGGGAAFLDSSAKVFLLDSVGISRMEKAGEYGNRLSRTSATLAVRP